MSRDVVRLRTVKLEFFVKPLQQFSIYHITAGVDSFPHALACAINLCHPRESKYMV
jgi:hypothetical protein